MRGQGRNKALHCHRRVGVTSKRCQLMPYQPRVDIHCHLLPNWDDGPHNLDEALAIARSAEAAGLQAIVATPHVDRETISRADRPAREIPAATERLQHEIQQVGIDLRVLPGAEVTLSPALPARLADEPWLCVAGLEQHILVELPPGAPWTSEVDELLFQIALQGLTPILAHPERYEDVQRDRDVARRASGRGILLQVTARSLSHDQVARSGDRGANRERHSPGRAGLVHRLRHAHLRSQSRLLRAGRSRAHSNLAAG